MALGGGQRAEDAKLGIGEAFHHDREFGRRGERDLAGQQVFEREPAGGVVANLDREAAIGEIPLGGRDQHQPSVESAGAHHQAMVAPRVGV